MASDRLTIAAARPGMRVVCVDASGNRRLLTEGGIYTVQSVSSAPHDDRVELSELPCNNWFYPSRFIPADPPAPALTPGLIETIAEWYRDPKYANHCNLRSAIEAAGILDKPAPKTTGREATISEGWWA